ncbi:vomeronasal 1 receptor ornAnaV1R3008 isoform X1 [Ornithorhynchus anatinus]|uniref:Vomeronasal type-1 receptor n=1 Tax=Ornithorhynchus anatinus TaxID=9258 RepID=F7BJD9_ORNAN|nr:vomeronasal 1 receptor ornAnaV1R3008 [Ornithorhynchus anatinus]XP_028909415.2 vomeronasal 1 receptor ornAnaV1R3008 isoform X1 [Ornithorhynchus anatinus]
MLTSDRIFGISFLFQTVVGVLGNAAMFLVYVRVFAAQPRQKKPTDLILTHLTLSNTGLLLTRGVPETMAGFGMKNILDDFGCKMLVYLRRVARGLSICTTCLLSVFQAVTVSPGTSRWARFKPRAPRYIVPSFLFFWSLNMSIYINSIKSAQATKNVTTTGNTYVSKYCSSIPKTSEFSVVATVTAIAIRDLFFVLLMSGASGYLVIVLRRHHRQVQHIHGTARSPRSSAETKAIRTILLLVICFVCFYCVDSCITFYISFMEEYDNKMLNTSSFISSCYSSVCPLVLIRRDPRFPSFQRSHEKGTDPSLSVSSRDQSVTPAR